MGFFKKFLSLGSKKSKRKQQARHEESVDPNGRIVPGSEPWQQADKEATRLLRSSSAHFSVVSEVDYSSLPPLPHPINSVVNKPVPTPAKSESSVQRRGTYTVKVLERKIEATTEFPNANPPVRNKDEQDVLQDSPCAKKRVDPRKVPFTPRDQGRLLRLRQDPSVASLLNMYDDKGAISSTAFSNTPPSSAPIEGEFPGRQQIKRSGSTLRQLLGEPLAPSEENAAEGDISWAERYLGEHAGSRHSIASTAPVETPKDTHFTTDAHSPKPFMPNFTFSSDVSQDLSINYPFISSMEVELSGATTRDLSSVIFEDAESKEPQTPKRAAEVFGFLTERRKSVLERQRSILDRSFTAPAVPEKDATATEAHTPKPTTPSPDTSDTSMSSSAQIHTATLTRLMPMLNPLSRSTDTLNLLYIAQSPVSIAERPTSPVLSPTIPCVQITGSSLSTVASTTSSHTTASKIPRGPRPLPSNGSTPRASKPFSVHQAPAPPKPVVPETTMELPTPAPTPASQARSRIPKHSAPPASASDPFTPVRPRHHKRRVASQASSGGSHDDGENSTRLPRRHGHGHGQARKASREAKNIGKENSPPSVSGVPLRTLFDVRHPNLVKGEPPSPASSTELSPVAKEMMMNLRKQRMRARDEIRTSARASGKTSRRAS